MPNTWTFDARAVPAIRMLTIVASALVVTSPIVVAQETGQTLVLFDSSGSMWGKLVGTAEPKFKAASAALRDALAAHKGAVPSPGLLVFGGRCSTAPLKVPPGPKSAKQFSIELGRLNPKGKGPISLALDNAAASLPKGSKSNVILIHDGPDNCRRDPCEAAAAFAKAHKGVAVHLVSIALPKASRIATACVAKLTGGTVAQVENAAQLKAAVQTAVKLAMPAPALQDAPKTAQAEDLDDGTENAADKTGPPRLRLSAKLGPKGKVLRTPVRWQVFPDSKDPDAKPLIDISEARLTLPLKPGPYSVVASIGQSRVRHTVEISQQGASVVNVEFDAGRLLLRAPSNTNPAEQPGQRRSQSTIVTLRLKTDSQWGNASSEKASAVEVLKTVSAPIVVADGGVSDVILPSGTYDLVIQKGQARFERTVTVSVGKPLDVDLNLGTGQLNLELSNKNADIVDDGVLYKISVDDPSTKTGRREVTRSTAMAPSFTLPAGTYYVSAIAGFAEAKTRVAVSTGVSKTVSLELRAAVLKLQSTLAVSGRGSQLSVQYRIIDISKAEREIALSSKRTPTLVLRPGKYRIVAEIGARNVTAMSEVELADGSTTDVKLSPRAGAVVLKLGGQSSAASINRYWVVRDHQGNVVWRTNAYTPSALLAPGVYEVSCETRAGELKTTFELAAGEDKSVELTGR